MVAWWLQVGMRRLIPARRLMPVAAAAVGCSVWVTAPVRYIASFGRVTDEDRRWWMVHLECAPDVTAGTFVSWLDSCGDHTTKKLVERNVWSIEQVAALSSDEVDELRFREGCVHMDVVWEHARTIIAVLKTRSKVGVQDTVLHDRIMELRKKRELERRREELLKQHKETAEEREARLEELRAAIAKKRELLRRRQRAAADGAPASDDASTVVDEMAAKAATPGKQE